MALVVSEALSFQYQRNLLVDSERALAEQERLKYRAGVIQNVVVDTLKVRNSFIANFNRPNELRLLAIDAVSKCRRSAAELQKLSTTCGKDEQSRKLVLELASRLQAMEPLLQELIKSGADSSGLQSDNLVNIALIKRLNPLLDKAFEAVKTTNAYDQMLMVSTTERDRSLREQQALVLMLALVFKALVAFTVVMVLSKDTSKRIKILLGNMSRLKNNRELNEPMNGNDEISLLDSNFHQMAEELIYLRKRDQAILETVVDNEQRIRKVLETLPIGITVSTLDGELEFANAVACGICDWNYASLPQQNIPELLDTKSRGSMIEVPANTLLQCPLELSTTEFDIGDGKRILSAFQDISVRTELQIAKSNFLAMISHDIRSPLQTVSSFLENLHVGRFGTISPDLENATSRLMHSTKVVNLLINDLLDVEKLESSSFLLDIRPVALHALIDEAIDAVDSYSAKQGVDFDNRAAADLTVEVDAARTVQVLVNIFSNAIKFSPPGTVVSIKTEVDNLYTKILVVDRGRGIPSDLQPLLFSKFRQIRHEDNRRDYGSGLGLAIARLIVEAHGGTIGVESRLNEGSTFWFTVKNFKAI